MELLTLKKIIEILAYEKNTNIDQPRKQYYISYIYIENKTRLVQVSRKSLKHILEKDSLGIFLVSHMREILFTSKTVVKNFKDNNRYFVFYRMSTEVYGIVIEKTDEKYSIVTAMRMDKRYLEKHFPNVSI